VAVVSRWYHHHHTSLHFIVHFFLLAAGPISSSSLLFPSFAIPYYLPAPLLLFRLHFSTMHTFKAVLLLSQLSAVFALPAPIPSANEARFISRNGAISPAPSPGTREEEGEEGGENEVQGAFDTPIVLAGGDVRTDVLFPPAVRGA
jgi:hypothetical protein